jgi:ribose/xylose/arabinose/galactoside ABC-type transport system permease subunit
LTRDNFLNILLQGSNVAIIAAGLTLVLVCGEIDLSIGSLEALSGAVAAVLVVHHGMSPVLAIGAGISVALLAGFISGLITWKLRVVSFITTLAMLGIAQGAAFLLTNNQGVSGLGSNFQWLGTGTIHGFPVPAVIAAVVVLVTHLLLTRTKLGIQMFAVGGNAEAASLAGIRVGRVKLYALTISGFTAGLGGIILSARLDSGNGLFGSNDLLPAVAAVVIGGTSLFGGYGTVIGTTIGVLIIATIADGLVLINVPDFWQQIVVGLIILGSVVVDNITRAAIARRQ